MGSVFAQLLANAMQDTIASEWLEARFLDGRQRGIEELANGALTNIEANTIANAVLNGLRTNPTA